MRTTLALLLAFFASVVEAQAPAQAPAPAELISALRQGGYVLYFRHTATDHTQNDSRMTSFEDCANQRNLVDQGRSDARMIGVSLRTLSIPIGKIFTSPHCRTVETAELAFGRGEKLNEARYSTGTKDDEARYAELRKLLAVKPAPKVNTVIVGHGAPIQAITGMSLGEGDIMVIRPLESRFEVLTRIRVQDWPALNAAVGK
jgi:broad specificity phosphatase PhoE